jgi:lysophospholipase L1-like esterase
VNASVAALSAFVGLLLADRVLGWAGLPSEPTSLFAHPPDFTEVRSSLDFSYAFRTNSQGLKSAEIPMEKEPGERRFLVVGDSFVEGYGVDARAAFPALLEAEFATTDTTVRFINGGLTGTGPLEYARLFVHLLPLYRPDALLFCVYANDVANTPTDAVPRSVHRKKRRRASGFAHWLFPRIHTRFALQRAKDRRRPDDFVQVVSARARAMGIAEARIKEWEGTLPAQLVAAVDNGRFNGAILSSGLLYPKCWVESLDIVGQRAECKWQAALGILDEVVRVARENEVWMGVVYVPARFQYDPAPANPNIWRTCGTEIKEGWLSGRSELQDRLASWAKASDVQYLDLTPALAEAIQAHPDLNWQLDDHWSPTGHRIAANAIADWLRLLRSRTRSRVDHSS